MKKVLLVPVFYLLILTIVTLILAVTLYMHAWIVRLALDVSPEWHIRTLLASLQAVLLPGSMISLVILILTVQHRGGPPLLLFPAIWLSFSGVLILLTTLLAPWGPLTSLEPDPFELSGKIHDYRDGALYLERQREGNYIGVILTPEETPRMRGGALRADGSGTAMIRDRQIEQTPANPFFNQALTPATEIGRVLKDFRLINVSLAYLNGASRPLLNLTILALGLVLTASWIFGRFTSWPLLNTVTLLFVIRLISFLLARAYGEGAQELLEMMIPDADMSSLLPFIMAAAAAVLIIWDLLFVPFSPSARRASGTGKR